MNIDALLAGLPDLDDDALVPTGPRADNLVAMDEHFVNADFALETDAPTFTKRDNERRDAQGRRWLGKAWSAPGR